MTGINRSVVTAVVFLGGLLAFSGSTRSAFAQADPAVGSWKLNVGKSRYSPGPAPKSQTITITAAGNGIRVSSKGVDGDGKATSTEYTASYDGKDVPVMFNLAYDVTSLKRVDANTSELTRKKGGKVVQTARRVISAEGKTMTITTTGVDDKNRRVDNVAVYDKQ
jgi:hypothetical protein